MSKLEGHPKKFKVTITETLKRTVEVEADDRYDAEQIVSDGWHNGEYTLDNVLDADNFIDVEIEAVPVKESEKSAEKTSET